VQVLPGVYQLNGLPYNSMQNTFLVHRDGATIVIDSGDFEQIESLPAIQQRAMRWGVPFDQVSHLFVTHEHFDHASHAAEMQRRGARVVASPESAEAMAASDLRSVAWDHDRVFEPCIVDDVLSDDQQMTIGGLTVKCIAAPGHCDGAVIYELVLDGEICWFIGDLLYTRGFVGPELATLSWTGAVDFDKAKSVETLKQLNERPCDHLFPTHGTPVIGSAKAVLGRALHYALVAWR
jgi:glyoxylase-like metal-dependent hydrolase (beta-lactamase superfamily II)